MVTRPAVHPTSITVGELRPFFADSHVHIALLVDGGGRLVGTVERADLAAATSDTVPAREIAALDGRTIRPEAALSEAIAVMRRGGRRRLAVTTEGSLLGLLCLKASKHGFCSDADVAARRQPPTDT
jgi:CBS domain-containing protein